jgi:hypothetical protein
MMRRAFDMKVAAYKEGRYLFDRDGNPYRGSSDRTAFWAGFEGINHAAIGPNTLGWAAYRAGQACAKENSQ